MRQYVPPMQRALPFSNLLVLVVVQAVVVLPFLQFLPVWLGAVLLMVMFWRWRVMHGEIRRAPRTLILLSVLVGIAGLLVSGLTRYTLDSAVALCVLGYLLKSLEVLRRRDGVFQVYLGYFLTGVYLLYHYNPLGALISIAMVAANTLALHAIAAERAFTWRRGMRHTTGLMAAAIPIMIVGFLFFPRLPPLWSIPNDQRGTSTGMTDEVEPGSISRLARDTSPAFRVAFEGPLPPRDQWYWRGTTLGEFDGQRWRAFYRENNRSRWPRANLPVATTEAEYSYTVILEATQQHWLYFLDWPVEVSADNARALPDGRAARTESLNQAFRYRATSSSEVRWQGPQYLGAYLQLPVHGNEALREWARQLRRESSDDDDFMRQVLSHVRSQPYFYTLEPPAYPGPDSLSDFWLNSRRGFCTHYASALAFIARSVGIPARLVGGYLGGVYNPNGEYIQVRQMEAHAWTEVWLDDRWVRIDPTEAVAPSRIETNLDDWLDSESPNELPFGSRLGRGLPLLANMGLWWDSVQYQWQILVLNYQQDSAIGLLETRFGRLRAWQVALMLAGFLVVLGMITAFATGLIRLPRRTPEPWASLNRLESRLGPRQKGETVAGYLERMSHTYPQVSACLSQVRSLTEAIAYDPDRVASKADQAQLKQLVQACKVSKPSRLHQSFNKRPRTR